MLTITPAEARSNPFGLLRQARKGDGIGIVAFRPVTKESTDNPAHKYGLAAAELKCFERQTHVKNSKRTPSGEILETAGDIETLVADSGD